MRALNAVCIIQMLLNLVDEYKEIRFKGSLLDYFQDIDNLIDFCCTIYAIAFACMRIYIGRTFDLHPNRVDQDLEEVSLFTWMPLLSTIAIVLMLVQWFFLLQTFNFMSKWIQLFTKGFKDALGFIVLYMIILISFSFMFSNLGVWFDAGNNYESEYDTNFNNYPNVPHFMVHFISSVRTSVGDV